MAPSAALRWLARKIRLLCWIERKGWDRRLLEAEPAQARWFFQPMAPTQEPFVAEETWLLRAPLEAAQARSERQAPTTKPLSQRSKGTSLEFIIAVAKFRYCGRWKAPGNKAHRLSAISHWPFAMLAEIGTVRPASAL